MTTKHQKGLIDLDSYQLRTIRSSVAESRCGSMRTMRTMGLLKTAMATASSPWIDEPGTSDRRDSAKNVGKQGRPVPDLDILQPISRGGDSMDSVSMVLSVTCRTFSS